MKEKKKSLVEVSALAGPALFFVFKSAASAIAGWIGLSLFQEAWRRVKSWFKGGSGDEHSEGVSQEKSEPKA